MDIQKREDGKILIRYKDNLIDNKALELRNELVELLSEPEEKFEFQFDLDEVFNIDAVAVSTLIALYNSIKENKGKVELINTSEEIYKLFNNLKIDEILNVSKKTIN